MTVAIAGCGGAEPPAAHDAPECRRFCVSVTPAEGDRRTVFTFTGRGWRPRQPVEAHFGPFCDTSEGTCDDLGKVTRFRTDGRGAFRLRFRNGPDRLEGEKPAANGSGPMVFEQWTGRAFRSRLIRRSVPYVVDGRRLEVRLGG